jgi:hypothetical protein
MSEPQFVVSRELRRSGADGSVRPNVEICVEIDDRLRQILMANFAHEVLMQKPTMCGSMPLSMHRDRSGLPVNTHLMEFLKGGDTIVITVETLIKGYNFRARSIWDAIAFEEFAGNAFERFKIICRHAQYYAGGRGPGISPTLPSGGP